jgi:competence protein ComEA
MMRRRDGVTREVQMKRITKVVAVGLLCGSLAIPLGGHAYAASVAGAGVSRVDINTASVEELARLPGIGPAKAQAIVEYRSEEPFRKPEDLRKVKGIGDKLYEQLKDQISVGGSASGSSDRGG